MKKISFTNLFGWFYSEKLKKMNQINFYKFIWCTGKLSEKKMR